MSVLDRLLGLYEERIDEGHCRNTETLHVEALSYHEVPRIPLTVVFPYVGQEFPNADFRDAFEDYERMMYRELLSDKTSIYNSIGIKDSLPYQIRPNYGTGIIASLFGLEIRLTEGNMPWVESCKSKEEILALVHGGVPSFDRGLGRKVMECLEFFNEKLSHHPKCRRTIRIAQPDLQGPFDIAHLVMGGSLFFSLHDEPGLVHELLAVITETYIRFRKEISRLLADRAENPEFSYIHGAIYKGSVLIKDDTAINLSPEMYEEFVKPYDEQILTVFPGGIHHCGKGHQWRTQLLATRNMTCLDFGNPEMQDLDSLYPLVKARGIPLANFGRTQNQDLLTRYDFKHVFNTGTTICIRAGGSDEASKCLDSHAG